MLILVLMKSEKESEIAGKLSAEVSVSWPTLNFGKG
jgi:hypothetical protein